MAEFAPAAIQAAWQTIHTRMPQAQLSGIIGGPGHTFGYHRGRNFVGSDDYSVQRDNDRQGHGNAASALDVTLGPADMRTVTRRLIAATQARDPRLEALREFFGTVNTTNGRDGTVTGLDVRDNRWITSDSTHLWHIHLSGYRRWSEDAAAWQRIADVFTGQQEDDDVPLSDADVTRIVRAMRPEFDRLINDANGNPARLETWLNRQTNTLTRNQRAETDRILHDGNGGVARLQTWLSRQTRELLAALQPRP